MRRATFVILLACLCVAACGGQSRSSGAPGSATSTGAPGSATSTGPAASATPTGPTGSATSTGARPGTSSQTSTTTLAAPHGASAPAARHRPHRPDPCPPRSAGSLPQTERVPSASSPCLHAVVRALWRGVREDSAHAAMYAFFPLQAYEQIKAIADPAGDYSARLLADYRLDLHAAHELLGRDAAAARLVGAIVPQAYVHWVGPGACYNRSGYYEVPNARLLYRIGGQVRSFGIASMISWRGIWYVVHLGAVTRAGDTGFVDDPSAGAGTPTPSPTC